MHFEAARFRVQDPGAFGLDSHFQLVDGGEIGVQKWQQIAALRAAGRVGDASLMVGDRAVDLVAAHRNGLCGAGVLWGHGSAEELHAESPRYLLDAPAQLTQWAVPRRPELPKRRHEAAGLSQRPPSNASAPA
ncbi:MAG: HAD hydrolase-like protein [Burkholderiaceae bacterium]